MDPKHWFGVKTGCPLNRPLQRVTRAEHLGPMYRDKLSMISIKQFTAIVVQRRNQLRMWWGPFLLVAATRCVEGYVECVWRPWHPSSGLVLQLTVFISSTFLDFRDERDEIAKVLNTLQRDVCDALGVLLFPLPSHYLNLPNRNISVLRWFTLERCLS